MQNWLLQTCIYREIRGGTHWGMDGYSGSVMPLCQILLCVCLWFCLRDSNRCLKPRRAGALSISTTCPKQNILQIKFFMNPCTLELTTRRLTCGHSSTARPSRNTTHYETSCTCMTSVKPKSRAAWPMDRVAADRQADGMDTTKHFSSHIFKNVGD